MSAPAFEPDRLRDVATPEDLVGFLAEELDWPFRGADLERVTYDYVPTDLGIPEEQVPQIATLRQLRPLTTAQPWGIFFVELAGPRLAITPLRRLLRGLVTRSRATPDGHRTWDLEDLLFFTTTDDGSSSEIHLLAFFEPEDGGRPEIRSLAWSPRHSTRLHLQRLAGELLGRLGWPENEDDAAAWRARWRAAFRLRPGEALTSAAQLAERMASVGRSLRETIEAALLAEDGEGPFTTLLDEVRDELVSDLDAAGFADVCAQTLVSGALTARVADPDGFGATPVLEAIPLGTSFLTAFFAQVSEQISAIDLDAAGMEGLVADLRRSNVETILDNFGATAAGGDPVIHFYETFLAAYDPGIRARVGAYYTPKPVVDCIVRLVDDVLRLRFGLEEGVADQSSWATVAGATGLTVPDGVNPDEPFVSVLDPATGTGTFLVSWLQQARRSYAGNDWSGRLSDGILPRLRAFELMLAPYAIAQLKVALEAGPDAVDAVTRSVLLTDTLELPGPVAELEGLNPVAREGERAAQYKRDGRPTVIIGNPPYGRVQREAGGGWVTHAEGDRPALMQDFIDLASARTIFSHVASLYDWYVYFWRWAIWKALEQPGHDAPGIVAFITGASWLDGPGFVGLREAARAECSEVWILDLGGDSRGTDPEENVFDIMTPVAVTVMVRAEPTNYETAARIFYGRVRGTRAEKLVAVAGVAAPDRDPVAWQELSSEVYEPFKPVVGGAEWTAMPALTDLLCWQQPGVQLNRTWPVAPDAETLRRRWASFLADEDGSTRAELFPNPESGRHIDSRVGSLPTLASLPAKAPPEPLVRYLWKAFDVQSTFRDARLAGLERPSLWQSVSDQQIFVIAPSAALAPGPGPAVHVSSAVPDRNSFKGSAGGQVLPLYRDAAGLEPNVPAGLLAAIPDAQGEDLPPLTPEALLAYLYALLSTPGYQLRFEAELADRLVRVPLTRDLELFREAVALGEELVWLHTFGERFSDGREDGLPAAGIALEQPITRLPADRHDLLYDPASGRLLVGDGVISGVSEEVMEFSVSGWPVVRRWLEHRSAAGRGRRGSDLDLIRPEHWDDAWTDELLDLLRALTRSIELQPTQDDLLASICDGPLIAASELPTPTAAERAVPRTLRPDELQMEM